MISGNKLREMVLDYISKHNTMTLATSSNNLPWAATVFYANNGFTLYFISNPNKCLHCQNIQRNPRVAITIDEDYPLKSINDWRKVKGVQMEGLAEMLTDEEELNRAVEVYVRKYPFTSLYFKRIISSPRISAFLEEVASRLKIASAFTASLENRFYKVIPLKVWFVNNEISFEKRLEVDLE